MKKSLIVLFLLGGCGGGGSFGGPGTPTPNPPNPTDTCTAIVDWEVPDTFVNGDQLLHSDLQKFTLYINEESGMDQAKITRVEELDDVYLIQWTAERLPAGEHWFYMTITTTNGEVSRYSNEISKFCN